MKIGRNVVIILLATVLGACRGGEAPLTGAYGSAVVAGQVVMESGSSPAGVEITAPGMSVVVGDDGRFVFSGLQEQSVLHLRRADGIDARFQVPQDSRSIVIELGTNAARSGRRRGVTPGRLTQIEGLVQSVGTDSLVVLSSHGTEVTVLVTATTVIRKGQTPVPLADLKAGDRVHVKAVVDATSTIAAEIIVQNTGDDDGDEGGRTSITANGPVTATGASEITVRTVPRGEMVVRVDANTVIKRQSERIALTDIRLGDEVNSQGSPIDDHTMLARQIEVRGKNKRK